MRRCNFLPGKLSGGWEIGVPLETSARTQHAFLVCAATAVACASLSLWEHTEWRVDQLLHERSVVRYQHAQAQLNSMRVVTQAIEQYGAQARRVGAIRGELALRLNRIAAFGDRLAPSAWLVSLEEDGHTLKVRARARNAGDAGITIDRVRSMNGLHAPETGDVHQAGAQGGQTVEFALTLKEQDG